MADGSRRHAATWVHVGDQSADIDNALVPQLPKCGRREFKPMALARRGKRRPTTHGSGFLQPSTFVVLLAALGRRDAAGIVAAGEKLPQLVVSASELRASVRWAPEPAHRRSRDPLGRSRTTPQTRIRSS